VSQNGQTRKARQEIGRGELDKIAARLKSGGSRAFVAIMAMEQEGLTDVKFTGNAVPDWDHQSDCH
tara:strand:- start:466 stop:663 length:198 start_codon:yes stop_codon:yes gene_type:complete